MSGQPPTGGLERKVVEFQRWFQFISMDHICEVCGRNFSSDKANCRHHTKQTASHSRAHSVGTITRHDLAWVATRSPNIPTPAPVKARGNAPRRLQNPLFRRKRLPSTETQLWRQPPLPPSLNHRWILQPRTWRLPNPPPTRPLRCQTS